VIELNKVLAGGVTSKVGGASSCRSGTPIVWEGPWGPNMESDVLIGVRPCLGGSGCPFK